MNQSKKNGIACYYCRRKFDDEIKKTNDHVVAKSKGGFDVDENKIDCCWNCNQWKSNKTLEQWLHEVTIWLKRGKHHIYSKIELGQIVGNIKKMIQEIHNKKGISHYKPR